MVCDGAARGNPGPAGIGAAVLTPDAVAFIFEARTLTFAELRAASVAVARGLVNFDAGEIPALLGRSSQDLKRELGAAYEREIVHRDDLVLL